MYKAKPIIFPIILFILIIVITIGYQTDLATSVSAYPPPTTIAPRSGYPAPTGTPILPTPVLGNVILDDPIYLPVIYNQYKPPTFFSVAGAISETQVLQVVPEGLHIDPYSWNRLPNQESSIQMIRSCMYYRNKLVEPVNGVSRMVFWEHWYWANRVNKPCWDPITQKMAVVVTENCPVMGQPCLDVEIDPTSTAGEERFKQIASQMVDLHGQVIWLVGNETDNVLQDALVNTVYFRQADGTIIERQFGSHYYAEFFADVYELVDEAVGQVDSPKLVFCQATYARRLSNDENMGLKYCEDAFVALQGLGHGADHIYALATHEYMHEEEGFGLNDTKYENGALLDGVRLVNGEDVTILEKAVEQWILYLQQFETWAESVGMGDKPLWLTEYGSLGARCFEIHPAYNGEGIPCMGVDLEATDPDHIFYGRTPEEGVWGLQMGQLNYLINSPRWEAAWWFGSIIGDFNEDGKCDVTVWIWGSNEDCRQAHTMVSRAGITYYQLINCLYWEQNCVDTDAYIMPPPTPNMPLPEVSCKDTFEHLCLPDELTVPLPMPTPTPTPITLPCGCGGGSKFEQCTQPICPDDT